MARVLQYICGGLVIGILSVFVNIHPAAAADCTGDGFCKNGGTCPSTDSTPCACVAQYTGDDCTLPTCSADSDCNSNGKCSGTDPDKKCECENGYSGDHCATAPCTDNGNECGDHGECTGTGSNVKCECKDDYSGTLCKTAPKSSSPAVRLSLMSLVVSSIVCFIVL